MPQKVTPSTHHTRNQKPTQFVVNDQVIEMEEVAIVPLLSIFNAPIVILDRSGRVKFFNTACEKLTGFSSEEICNKKVWDMLILPEEQEAIRGVFSRLCTTEVANQQSNYWKTKQGSTVYIAWKNTAVRNKAGRIKYIISTGSDQTREKNLALKVELEKQFPLIFEAAPDGMLAICEDGTIAYANAQIESLFGYERQELEGSPVEVLIPERLRAKHIELRKAFRKSPQRRAMGRGQELLARRKDGSEFYVAVSLSPVKIGNKNLIVSAIRDESDTKRLEQELKAHLKEKDELFAELHHRVKNNLHLLMSFMRLTSRSIADKKALKAFNEVRERIQCTAVLHELLQESADLKWINLKEYIGKLVVTLTAHYSSPEIPIKITMEFDEITLDMKEALNIGLILNELLSNSSKYAFPAEMNNREIRIFGKKIAEGSLVMTVSDNGVGLPENFSLDAPKSLGTRLIGQFIKEMKGRAEVFNDDGAVFRFTLPFKEHAGAGDRASETPRPD